MTAAGAGDGAEPTGAGVAAAFLAALYRASFSTLMAFSSSFSRLASLAGILTLLGPYSLSYSSLLLANSSASDLPA